MEWKDLAPWIAIAVTLILSILVPLFTQIANNNHQRKMLKEKLEYEKHQEKEKVYREFLKKVGGVIFCSTPDSLIEAGAIMYQVYLFSPSEWWADLDKLTELIKTYQWEMARETMQRLSRLISEELNCGKGKNQ